MYKLFTKNLGIKIICLVGAAILWIYVATAQNSVAKFPGSVKIKVFNTQTNLVAVYDVKEVEIKVMTDSANWQKLSAESFSAYVDLSSYKAGTYEVPINVVSSVSGVQIVEKKPDKILISLETVLDKEVPVVKKITGNAAEGMTAGTVLLSPDKATIRGAKSLVDNIQEVTAEVVLNGESADFTKKVPLSAVDSSNSGRTVEITPSEVEAKVFIVKGSNIKSVGVKPTIKGTPKTNYFISDIVVNPSVVDITGPSISIADIKSLETSSIDIAGAVDTISKDVLLKLPSGVSLSDSSISTVHVEIKISSISITRDITTSNFKYSNNSQEIASLSSGEVIIKCSGSSAVFDNLDKTAISVLLNFDKKTPNTFGEVYFDLSPSDITVPAGVEIITITTKNITAKMK